MRASIVPAFLVLALSLTGCKLWDPDFMPAGYSYHQNEYNSPPGPEAPDIGYEYSAQENAEQLMAWRVALRDLLAKARAQGVHLPASIKLQTDLAPSAFSSSYDYILREGLRAQEHVLSNDEDAAPVFYSAYEGGKSSAPVSTIGRGYNGESSESDNKAYKEYGPESTMMDLVIGVIEGGELVREVRSTYELPTYGFTPGAYVAGHDNPLKQQHSVICPPFCGESTLNE